MAPPETRSSDGAAAAAAPPRRANGSAVQSVVAANGSRLLPAVLGTQGERPYWFAPLLALIASSIALGSVGFVGYRFARESLTNAVGANLASVARLKTLQINHWLDNAAAGLKAQVDSPQFTAALQAWEGDGERDGKHRAQLLELLNRFAATSHYSGIDLWSTRDGSVLLTSNFNDDADARKALAAASANGPVLDDFHADERPGASEGLVRVGYFYPCRTPSSAKVLAVVHIELDPTDILGELAQEWPSLSRSAETVLVRRDGSDVVFLTTVRDQPNAKALMRMPLSRPDFVEAEAVMGGSGYLFGVDYTDDSVLAYALSVNNTPWFIVAQVDQAEAYEQLRTIAALVTAATGALLILGLGWWATHQRDLIARRRADRELHRLESERADNLQRIAEASRRVVDVQESERRRLSGDLHDLIGANLASVDLLLTTVVRSLPAGDKTPCAVLLPDCRSLLQETISQVREFSSDLRPVILDVAGIVPALKECALRFARRSGIQVNFANDGLNGRLSTQVESVVYRIAQEALTNCAKHADAKYVSIRLSKTDRRFELVIEDDGDGFELHAERADGIGGLGLVTMRERAEFAGGRLVVTSRPGAGTRVCLMFDDVVEV